ncbi:MAG: hypothetical protein FWG98_08225 [Candidatus Cloacimonetes bacterium]|nr:hypothetical protein [Candidatus Cloacimonadota bacterium]
MKKVDCYVCGRVNLSKDEIGISKKLLSRETKQFYCLDCLAEYLDIEKEFLLTKIEEFKEDGCVLF